MEYFILKRNETELGVHKDIHALAKKMKLRNLEGFSIGYVKNEFWGDEYLQAK